MAARAVGHWVRISNDSAGQMAVPPLSNAMILLRYPTRPLGIIWNEKHCCFNSLQDSAVKLGSKQLLAPGNLILAIPVLAISR